MQIHELHVAKKPKRKRIGRGKTGGTYSGRGVKGQGARTGSHINPLFEGGRSTLTDRLKKLRGFKSIHPKKNVVSLAMLEKCFENGETVSRETMVAKGLMKEALAKNGVKILANGSLTKKLVVAANVLLSDTAKAAVEKAGGSVDVPEVQ
jgi:large subunit ribosomal protein L15